MKQYLILLDYNNGSVHIFEKEDTIDDEEFIESKGFSLSHCHYMTTNNLKLQIYGTE